MKKTAFGILAVLLVLTGCVSTKTFKQAVTESEALRVRIDNIERENRNLNDEIATLKSVLEDLKAENEGLHAANLTKDEEITSLKGEVERLKVKAGEISSAKEQEIENVKKTYESLVHEMKQEIEKGEIKITRVLDRLSVNLVEKVLFDSGKAEIKPKGKEILARVAGILKKVTDKQIRIEGHTDDVPIGPRIRDRFPTNWELSTTRATTVVRYLQDTAGLDPRLLSGVGYSKYRPVADNDSVEGRAQNRRIEIVLLPLDIDRVLEELKK